MATGTFTFLFTDIEGSTRLWDSDPDAMREALRWHDGILRRAIEENDGRVFKTVGDAFYGAFANASDAFQACIDAQRNLQAASGPIKVRMSLHTGQAEMRDNDYFGPPLNRVARLLSTAHGEQVVVSQVTRDLVQEVHEMAFLGTHRLKDLAEPEKIWQLNIPGCRTSFPPLRSTGRGNHNIPAQSNPIVGRERELEELVKRVQDSRLVTITGPGGVGKTRIAQQLGLSSLEIFPDGVWFVELAQLSDSAWVASEIASATGMREQPGKGVSASLEDHLRDSQCLILLDNCEHLLDSVPQVVNSLLGATSVKIVATSREALSLRGEQVYRLASLTLPNGDDPDQISQAGAVQLFVERARAVLPDFDLSNEDAPVLAGLCRKLDGLPLAIELAAAKLKVLRLDQIAERVEDRFRLLGSRDRTALPRQQTLRALIDWSYDLLAEDERQLMRELSVFSGTWGLEAAEEICSGDVLDLIAALVDKSIVAFDGGRYWMLETIRQYALEKLTEAGEQVALQRRHRDYYQRFAEAAGSALRGPDQARNLKSIDQEQDNLRSAMEFSAEDPDGAVPGLRLVTALRLFWDNRGHYSEGRASFARALAHPGIERGSKSEADALCNAAILAWNQADYTASREMQERALAIRRSLGDAEGIAESLLCLGSQAYREGEAGVAQTLLFAALGMAQSSTVLRCQTLLWLGIESLQRHALAEAREYLSESLDLAKEIGWGRAIAMAMYDLADVELLSSRYPEAREHLDGSLGYADELGTFTVFVIESYVELAAAEGKEKRAARLLGAAEAFRERKSLALPSDNRIRLLAVRDRLRESLGPDFQTHYASGRQLPWDEILFEARHEEAAAQLR